MRLWTIHPKYLDRQGLLGLWREGLLAKKVLEGKTNGYKNHPQLSRFRKSEDPLAYLNTYLMLVAIDGMRRGYSFSVDKLNLNDCDTVGWIPVTSGQVLREIVHLGKKLMSRGEEDKMNILSDAVTKGIHNDIVHPVFMVVDGPVEDWEKSVDAGEEKV